MKILVKYAEIDHEAILKEIAQIEEKLGKEKDQTMINKFRTEMKGE